MKMNLQLFGGRGASSTLKNKVSSTTSQSIEEKFPIPDNMSKRQKYRLEYIRNSVLDTLYRGTKDNYEIKRFDVRVTEINDKKSFVSVSVETGLKGDEGTMASILAREKAIIFIGKNGGMKHAQWSNTKNKTTKYLYQAFADYRSNR